MLEFRSYLILESILEISDDFYKIVQKLKGVDDVANSLFKLFGKDINLSQNYLSVSKNKNDEVSFINDGQAKRMVDKGENPFDKKGNAVKIGRLVRQLLSANNVEVVDSDIEKFVNKYKNAWDYEYDPSHVKMKIVRGEEIKHWYHHENYVTGGGDLNSSCMRYDDCQDYFDIYIKNPDTCGLLIYLNEEGKLLGRALVWNCKKGTGTDIYLDRTYCRFDKDYEKFEEWVTNTYQGKKIGTYDNSRGTVTVEVKEDHYEYYPYMDTLGWFYPRLKLLSDDSSLAKGVKLELKDTDGEYASCGYVYSRFVGDYLKENDVIWIEEQNSYVPREKCIVMWNNNNSMEEYCVFSDLYKSWIHKGEVIETEYGLAPETDIYNVYTDEECKTQKRIPGIFRDKEFVLYRNDVVRRTGILSNLAIMDIFGAFNSKGDKTLIDMIECKMPNNCFDVGVHINGRRSSAIYLKESNGDNNDNTFLKKINTWVRFQSKSDNSYKIPIGISATKHENGRWVSTFYMTDLDTKFFGFKQLKERSVIRKSDFYSIMYNSYIDLDFSKIEQYILNSKSSEDVKSKKLTELKTDSSASYARNNHEFRKNYLKNIEANESSSLKINQIFDQLFKSSEMDSIFKFKNKADFEPAFRSLSDFLEDENAENVFGLSRGCTLKEFIEVMKKNNKPILELIYRATMSEEGHGESFSHFTRDVSNKYKISDESANFVENITSCGGNIGSSFYRLSNGLHRSISAAMNSSDHDEAFETMKSISYFNKNMSKCFDDWYNNFFMKN